MRRQSVFRVIRLSLDAFHGRTRGKNAFSIARQRRRGIVSLPDWLISTYSTDFYSVRHFHVPSCSLIRTQGVKEIVVKLQKRIIERSFTKRGACYFTD